MTQHIESNFPKMGEHALEGSLVNMSGARSPYTQPVARKGPAGDSESEPSAVRGGMQISGEHCGPTFRPVATVSYPNSPEVSQTGRGLRAIPSVASRTGNGDFWNDRASQSGQVIS